MNLRMGHRSVIHLLFHISSPSAIQAEARKAEGLDQWPANQSSFQRPEIAAS